MAPFISSKTEKPYLLDDVICGVGISLPVARAVTYPGAPSAFQVGRGWTPGLCCGTSVSYLQPAAVFILTSTGCFLFQLILCSIVFYSALFDYGF